MLKVTSVLVNKLPSLFKKVALYWVSFWKYLVMLLLWILDKTVIVLATISLFTGLIAVRMYVPLFKLIFKVATPLALVVLLYKTPLMLKVTSLSAKTLPVPSTKAAWYWVSFL